MTPRRKREPGLFSLKAHTGLIGGLLLTLTGLGIRDHFTVNATAGQVDAIAVDVRTLLDHDAASKQRMDDRQRDLDELRAEVNELRREEKSGGR